MRDHARREERRVAQRKAKTAEKRSAKCARAHRAEALGRPGSWKQAAESVARLAARSFKLVASVVRSLANASAPFDDVADARLLGAR